MTARVEGGWPGAGIEVGNGGRVQLCFIPPDKDGDICVDIEVEGGLPTYVVYIDPEEWAAIVKHVGTGA
jgi:hypothetical protein